MFRKICVAAGLFLSLPMIRCSAGNQVHMSSFYSIEGNVSEATVYHYTGGGEEHFQLEPKEIDSVREWFSELRGRKDVWGKAGEVNGGQSFHFVFTGEDTSFFTFVYFDCGEDQCYLIVNNHWYEVLNPSPLPINFY